MSVVNPDLIRERNKCSFNPLELTHLLDGGANKTKERKELENFFIHDSNLKSSLPVEYMSHKEKYEEAIRKACIVFTKVKQLETRENSRDIFGGHIGSAILTNGNPLIYHYLVFIPALLNQASPEQLVVWLNRSRSCQIIGTYAQTELGHGTFVRGLETTATYDARTQEFVLNSPKLTSYKWWPGGLAHTANYAVVVAQLVTKEKCHGIHVFIVQLRDEDTHEPLAGIEIGEIGPKLGINESNNGFLGLHNVRIPREQMLMKYSRVLKDGTYVKSPHDKLAYGTMTLLRVVIVQGMCINLQKAVTIAVRYSAVRHQSQLNPHQSEVQILDYVTQQYKLFPAVAMCFAFLYSAERLSKMYTDVTEDINRGQWHTLAECHALSCCLKAVCTADCALAVETCRLACGGHGYMTSSNLPVLYSLVTAACTYEGENTVLLLQTARYLIKSWQQFQSGATLIGTVKYLQKHVKRGRIETYKSVTNIVTALENIAAWKIQKAARHIDERMRRDILLEDAWNQTSIELIAAAEDIVKRHLLTLPLQAHCRPFLVKTLYHKVQQVNVSQPLRQVLHQLAELYAVYTLLKRTDDLLRFTSATNEDIEYLQNWLENLLEALRPNAVGIVDAFDIPDDILSSTLGCYDGRVYERLFEEAQRSPLNAEPENKPFQMHFKPFLKANL